MGWLTKITGILKLKWIPYVALSWAVSVGGVALYSYMKGKSVVEKRMAHEIATALEAQMRELERVHDADLKTVVHTLAKEQELKHDIEDIKFPEIGSDCEHVLHEWLSSFNEAVNAVSTDPSGAD